MIQPLRMQDMDALYELAAPYMDSRLRFSRERATNAIERLVSDAQCFAMAEWEDGKMVGAVSMMASSNAFAEKKNASLVFWFGRLKLLKLATQWAENRPVIRAINVAFTREVDHRVYMYLHRLGYAKEGDLMVKWR